MHCEEYMISILNVDNFTVINEMADMYNAENLVKYCSWFYRRHFKGDDRGLVEEEQQTPQL